MNHEIEIHWWEKAFGGREKILTSLHDWVFGNAKNIESLAELHDEGLAMLKQSFGRDDLHVTTEHGLMMVLCAGLSHRMTRLKLEWNALPKDGDGAPLGADDAAWKKVP